MKFLVDNQLPLRLADYLRGRGHECSHVLEEGSDEAGDSDLWVRACGEGSILISKDDDFVILANRPGDTGRLVWVRLGNCRNAALVAAFERVHDDMIRAFEGGQRIIELR